VQAVGDEVGSLGGGGGGRHGCGLDDLPDLGEGLVDGQNPANGPGDHSHLFDHSQQDDHEGGCSSCGDGVTAESQPGSGPETDQH